MPPRSEASFAVPAPVQALLAACLLFLCLPLAAIAQTKAAGVYTVTPLVSPRIPAQVTGLSGAATSSVCVSWTWNAISTASAYEFFPSGGSVFEVDATSYAECGLSANAPATASVAAKDSSGEGAFSSPDTVYTLALPPTQSQLTAQLPTSISVQWDPGADPAYTRFLAEAALSDSFAVDAATALVQGSSATLSGLTASTTYYLRVRAQNGDGILTARDSLMVAYTPTGVSPQSAQSAIGGQGGELSFTPPAGLVQVVIPPGAFSSSLTVTLVAPQSFPEALTDVANLSGTGVGLQITLDRNVQPQQPVLISLSYAQEDINPSEVLDLVIARFDPVEGLWVPLASTSDPAQRVVTAYTSHFSLFQIMQIVPMKTLAGPKVFPNPWRPSLGETAVTFSNLPAGTDLKIFDILGEKVRELDADASGMAIWDGKNANGQAVATGVYFVLAGSGSSRRTLKVGIVR